MAAIVELGVKKRNDRRRAGKTTITAVKSWVYGNYRVKHVKNGIKRSKISDEIKNQLDQLLMLAVEYSSFTAEFLSSINIDRFFAVIDHINSTISKKAKIDHINSTISKKANGRY